MYIKSGMRSVGLIMLLLIAGGGGCGKEKSDAEYLEEAKKFQDRGELSKAGIELKNALQVNPDNIEARRLLGLLYLMVGNGEGAEKELQRAVDLKISYQAVALPLLQSVYLQRDYRRMLQQIKMPEGLDRESQAEWYVLRGRARIEMGQLIDARSEFAAAARVAPESKQVFLGRSLDAFYSKNYEGAERQLDLALSKDPKFAEALTLKGDILRLQGKLQEAEALYTSAILARRINLGDIYKRARVRIDLKNYAGAEADANSVAARVPNSVEAHLLKGILSLNNNNAEAAETALREAARLIPGNEEIQYYLAVAISLRNQPQQAKAILESLVIKDPYFYPAVLALSTIEIKAENYNRARTLLLPFVASKKQDAAFLKLYVDLLIRAGEYQEALPHALKLIEIDPRDVTSRILLGSAYLGLNRYADAIGEFDRVLVTEPDNYLVRGLKVKAFIAAGQMDQAMDVASKWAQDKKQDADALLALAEIYRKIGDLKSARDTYLAILAVQKNNAIAMNGIAQLNVLTKRSADALSSYQALWNANPGNVDAALALSAEDFKQGRSSTGIGRLELAIDRNPADLRPMLSLGEYYLNANRADKTVSILRPGENKFGNDSNWLNLMVAALVAEKNVDSARNLMEKLDNIPGADGIKAYWWAQIHALSGESELANTSLENAYRINPENLRIGLAYFRKNVLTKDYGSAQSVIDSLARYHPDEPEVYAQRGWYELMQKQYSNAVSDLMVAYEKAPTLEVLINLSRAAFSNNQFNYSVELLSSGLKKFGNNVALFKELAEMYLVSGMPDQAVQVMRKAVSAGVNDPIIYNNLAWQLKDKEPAVALGYANKAVELAPNSAGVQDTLGQILVEQKQYEQGLRALSEAVRMSGGDLRIRLHYIEALINARLLAQAKNEIQIVEKILQKIDSSSFEGLNVIRSKLVELKSKI